METKNILSKCFKFLDYKLLSKMQTCPDDSFALIQ